MVKKRKLNKIRRLVLVCALIAFCFITAVPSMETEAAITGQETSFLLINTEIGRYKLNYTGNTNHYAYWNSFTGQPVTNSIYNDTVGWGNSSTAILTKTPGASGIKYAFLVWETRAPEGATKPVVLRLPDGRRGNIYPTYAVNDWRVVGGAGMNSMYCMAADVTSIVQSSGYGSYTVCNIPRWYWGVNGDVGGGEAPGSWQLIVVEEGEDFPVRAVTLDMGARFKLEENLEATINFSNGVRSKSSGTATGQIFFGASNVTGVSGSIAMTENISSYDGSGGLIANAVSNTTTRAGLYRNGGLVNGRDYTEGCIRMDLSDVDSNIGNNAKTLKSYIENTGWTTFFMLGTAVDIAFPDFTANQTTTANSSTSVTVGGNIKNLSASANTGIYDGKLVVNIDSALNVTSATAVVDGNKNITGVVSGNTVTFSGEAIKNVMKGTIITYTVECTPNGTGTGCYENSDSFSGKLRADGADTNYWIDNACTSSSYALAKYKVTLNKGTGIKDVSGGGEYTYGQKVTIDAELLPGYHWKDWTGSYNTTIQKYTFDMPAQNITLTANGEANEYIVHYDPNDGTQVIPILDMTVRYDGELALPDATDAYVKYTLDGVNVTQSILDGTLVLTPSQTDLVDAPDTESEPNKKAYASVFMGWSFEEEKDRFIPQWKAGEPLMVSDLIDMAGMTDANGATVTLYAVWDDCPWIVADSLYYTLAQAQSGFITQDEILSHASASDREDGSPIAPGVHEDGTSFTIPDYLSTDFTQFEHEGSITENLTVIDSVGNTYRKQITVYIVDTAAAVVEPEGTTRFIDEHYYYQPYENGGLEENSVWKTDPEYAAALQEAFENLRNDTPMETYAFSHEEILEMKQFINEWGVGDMQSEERLRQFYHQFCTANIE